MNKNLKQALDIFKKISEIPRCSTQEEKICKWLQNWAKDQGFDYEVDSNLNLVIRVPSTKGYETAPVIILQSHMDMVCEKTPDSSHDFKKDPIEIIFDGDWIKANKTTLGADDASGMAIALCVASNHEISHPSLELLFTTQEENGLIGALLLEPNFLKGRTLINLDSGDEGAFTVGCAGGITSFLELPLEYETCPLKHDLWKLTVSGLKGGHSGIDIDKGRANANKLLARTLDNIYDKTPLRLLEIKGGSRSNAIPRDASAVFAIENVLQNNLDLNQIVSNMNKIFQNEYKITEPDLLLSLVKMQVQNDSKMQIITAKCSKTIINLLLALPTGINELVQGTEGLVETSNNLAIIDIKNDRFTIVCSQRSAIHSKMMAITKQIETIGHFAGATSTHGEGYSGWEPNLQSPLLKRCKEIYQKLFEKTPEIKVVHAGLECGVIGAKYQTNGAMDMIAIGADLENAHSPDERMNMVSFEKALQFVTVLLRSFRE